MDAAQGLSRVGPRQSERESCRDDATRYVQMDSAVWGSGIRRLQVSGPAGHVPVRARTNAAVFLLDFYVEEVRVLKKIASLCGARFCEDMHNDVLMALDPEVSGEGAGPRGLPHQYAADVRETTPAG